MEFLSEQQPRETSRGNKPYVPILSFSSSGTSSSFLLDSKEAICLSNSRDVFDEGTLAFSSPIHFDLIEIHVNQVERYRLEQCSNRIIRAASLFNTGISKSRESDLDSAKKCFCQALDHLHDVDLASLECIIPTVAMRHHVLVTISILTGITLLNLGHVEFHQSNFTESSHFYHQCLDHLKSLRLGLWNSNQSEMYQEAIFYSSYIMAACLNCIGISILKKEITEQQEGAEHDLIQAKAKSCFEYLKASITLYEECSRYHEKKMTFNANMATAFNNLGRVYFIMDDFVQSLECYQVCLNLRLTSLPANHLDISVSYFNMGQALQALGQEEDIEEVLDHYLTFLAIAAPTLGYADESIVKAVVLATDIYTSLGNLEEAESILHEYLSASAFTSPDALKSKVILLTTLSTVFASQQKLEDSLETLVQARDLILTMPEDDFLVHCYIANSSNIAMILTRNGDYEKALVFYQRALLKINRLEKQEPFLEVLIDLHLNVADVYEGMEDISHAITHLKRAVAIAKNFHGFCEYKVSTYLNRLGLLLYKGYKYESALSCFFECLNIRTQTISKGTKSQITSVLYNIATVYRATGEADRALEVLFKVLDHERELNSEGNDEEIQPKDHILTLRSIFEIYADQSVATPEKGIEYLLEAMRMCRLHKDTIDASLGRSVFFSLGDFLTSSKKAAEGFKYYCEGCELFGADTDTNVIVESGGNGRRIMLAQMCTDKNMYPLHAAAA
ncbi:hypothetical protein CTEN210_06605 [Chaetoceros tenuissimus]|uniref:MalT-like TPR region domain-containing protein n=1 Tax=Chaetoceros tenuissimus TaxID=426638 RepID=A0AAD3CT08_9STRA|nr:hypothetical protein CTEN210_06605 [Chaetoceros tenuissimus]